MAQRLQFKLRLLILLITLAPVLLTWVHVGREEQILRSKGRLDAKTLRLMESLQQSLQE